MESRCEIGTLVQRSYNRWAALRIYANLYLMTPGARYRGHVPRCEARWPPPCPASTSPPPPASDTPPPCHTSPASRAVSAASWCPGTSTYLYIYVIYISTQDPHQPPVPGGPPGDLAARARQLRGPPLLRPPLQPRGRVCVSVASVQTETPVPLCSWIYRPQVDIDIYQYTLKYLHDNIY